MKAYIAKNRPVLITSLWLAFATIMAIGQAYAASVKLPNDATTYLPVLVEEIDAYWADMDMREFSAGLVEQESLWKLKATLKTSREFGCGFGQFTRTFNANGSVRFDALEETKRLDKSLAAWNWTDCYNARFQLRGMILKLKQNERSCKVWMANLTDVKKCDGAAYNGGLGGFSARIRMCRTKADCNPRVWDGHLEKQCAASNVKQAGYGESFCQINSKYPGRILNRMDKYRPYMYKNP